MKTLNPLTVPCIVCNVDAGHSCVTYEDGEPRGPHAARIYDAQEAAAQ